jgi:hypothetical protein
MDQELAARRQRAEQAGYRFGFFVGSVVKGALVGLGVIFALVLILNAF